MEFAQEVIGQQLEYLPPGSGLRVNSAAGSVTGAYGCTICRRFCMPALMLLLM